MLAQEVSVVREKEDVGVFGRSAGFNRVEQLADCAVCRLERLEAVSIVLVELADARLSQQR